jgi:hypothetical protein
MYGEDELDRTKGILEGTSEDDWDTEGIRFLTQDVLPSRECRICVLDGWLTDPPPPNELDKYTWVCKRSWHQLVPENFPLLQPTGFLCEYLAVAWVLHNRTKEHWSLLVLHMDSALCNLSQGFIRFHHYDSIAGYSKTLSEQVATRLTKDYLVTPDGPELSLRIKQVPWHFQRGGTRECGMCVGAHVALLSRYLGNVVLGLQNLEPPDQVGQAWERARNELAAAAKARLETATTTLQLQETPLEWCRARLQRGTRCMVLSSSSHETTLLPRVLSYHMAPQVAVDTILIVQQHDRLWAYYPHRRVLFLYSTNTLSQQEKERLWALPEFSVPPTLCAPLPAHPLWMYRVASYLALAGTRRLPLDLRAASVLCRSLPQPATKITAYTNWIRRPLSEWPSAPFYSPDLLLAPMAPPHQDQPAGLALLTPQAVFIPRSSVARLLRVPLTTTIAAPAFVGPIRPNLHCVLIILVRPLTPKQLHDLQMYADSNALPGPSPDESVPWHNGKWLMQALASVVWSSSQVGHVG